MKGRSPAAAAKAASFASKASPKREFLILCPTRPSRLKLGDRTPRVEEYVEGVVLVKY